MRRAEKPLHEEFIVGMRCQNECAAMLNERVDFNFLYIVVALTGVAFLAVMGFGFIYFSRLKKRDEEKRERFKGVISELESKD